MSAPPSPVLSETHLEDMLASPTDTSARTVAMIKTHALEHRFEIESRIVEAGFEIVKERQMEFDIETDPETMFELFGEDYETFAEGPVWVYVLERMGAIDAFHDLMGNEDPEIARQEWPESLRAVYGVSRLQNAVMGSPDEQTAEIQISSIFASSPPFPTTQLPDVTLTDGSAPPSESSLAFEYETISPAPVSPISDSHRAVSERSSETRSSTVNGHSNGNGKPRFRARPVPVTNDKPDIVPRMSRAAALRTGMDIEATKPKHYPATEESLRKTFEGVPGHKRNEIIHVASTEAPVVAPRMTRAASLRLGLGVPEEKKHRRLSAVEAREAAAHTFEGVPGHKRRESFSVASTKPPAMPPRTNRSATLRIHKEAAPPPSSFNIRSPNSFSRSSSRTSYTGPSVRSPSSASVDRSSSSPTSPVSRRTRPISALALKPAHGPNVNSNGHSPKPASSTSASDTKPLPSTPPPSAFKARPRPSVVTSPPSIAPRTNKSAQLRAAKMADTQAAAAASASGRRSLGGAGGSAIAAAAKTPKKIAAHAVKAAA